MTNYEYFASSLGLEELAQALCDIVDHKDVPKNAYCCDYCIAKDKCNWQHNGFIDWLQEEHRE